MPNVSEESIYTPPDFSAPHLQAAPPARVVACEADGVLPEGFFATTNLPSVEELRVLVVFVEGRERWHNADTIAKTLHISDTVAQAALDHLARRNLLDIRVTDDVRYRFRPGTPLLESQATAVVATYRRNPRQILKLIN